MENDKYTMAELEPNQKARKESDVNLTLASSALSDSAEM